MSSGPAPRSSSAPRARLPWLRVGVESLAIVASILLAFAIDAWWDSRGRAVELGKILTTLEGDFRTYQETLALDRAVWDHVLENMDFLLRAVAAEEPPSDDAFEAALMMSSHASTFDARSGAVDALVLGGQLARIPDPELRALLAETPRLVDNMVEAETTHRVFVEQILLPYLTGRGYQADLMLERLDEWSPPELGIEVPRLPRDRAGRADDFAALRADPEFHVLLARRYKWTMIVLWSYHLAERNVEDVLKRLGARGA